jgi:hypothetical protein
MVLFVTPRSSTVAALSPHYPNAFSNHMKRREFNSIATCAALEMASGYPKTAFGDNAQSQVEPVRGTHY